MEVENNQKSLLLPNKDDNLYTKRDEKEMLEKLPVKFLNELNTSSLINHTVPLKSVVRIKGEITKGFGRGSKLIGIPTANLPADKFEKEIDALDLGVYIGWASVSNGKVYKTVLSIGDNPYFKNTHKTIEPYLIHDFNRDLYGEELKVIITGYMRGMNIKFDSLDELILAIKNDILVGGDALEHKIYKQYENDDFFKE